MLNAKTLSSDKKKGLFVIWASDPAQKRTHLVFSRSCVLQLTRVKRDLELAGLDTLRGVNVGQMISFTEIARFREMQSVQKLLESMACSSISNLAQVVVIRTELRTEVTL